MAGAWQAGAASTIGLSRAALSQMSRPLLQKRSGSFRRVVEERLHRFEKS
jgi:hypothetical protein